MKRFAILLAAVLLPSTIMAQSPTPMQTKAKPAYDQNAPKPAVRYQRVQGGWQRFQGATRCEQVEKTLSCDNGYKQTVR